MPPAMIFSAGKTRTGRRQLTPPRTTTVRPNRSPRPWSSPSVAAAAAGLDHTALLSEPVGCVQDLIADRAGLAGQSDLTDKFLDIFLGSEEALELFQAPPFIDD